MKQAYQSREGFGVPVSYAGEVTGHGVNSNLAMVQKTGGCRMELDGQMALW